MKIKTTVQTEQEIEVNIGDCFANESRNRAYLVISENRVLKVETNEGFEEVNNLPISCLPVSVVSTPISKEEFSKMIAKASEKLWKLSEQSTTETPA